jgi:hypothetical protein
LIILKGPGISLESNSFIKLEVGQPAQTKCLAIGCDANKAGLQEGAEGPVQKSNNFYTYRMDTAAGLSGGPLLISGTQKAIGVHIFGITGKSNFTAPITAEFIDWVKRKSPEY